MSHDISYAIGVAYFTIIEFATTTALLGALVQIYCPTLKEIAPYAILPAVVGEIELLKILTGVSLPFLRSLISYVPVAGSGSLTTSNIALGANKVNGACPVTSSVMLLKIFKAPTTEV